MEQIKYDQHDQARAVIVICTLRNFCYRLVFRLVGQNRARPCSRPIESTHGGL